MRLESELLFMELVGDAGCCRRVGGEDCLGVLPLGRPVALRFGGILVVKFMSLSACQVCGVGLW